jgi:hypothetical protein
MSPKQRSAWARKMNRARWANAAVKKAAREVYALARKAVKAA